MVKIWINKIGKRIEEHLAESLRYAKALTFILFSIFFTCILFLGTNSAFAQNPGNPDVPDFGAQGSGSSGIQHTGAVSSLVAATLQTKGLFDQAKLLDKFPKYLNSLAALIYLVAFLGAIFSMSVFGSYKQGAYLLIGPALFTFMLSERTRALGTKVQFGDKVINSSIDDQKSFLSFIGQDFDTNAPNVSRFYAYYDSLVTYTVQKVVSVIRDPDEDLRRAWRERMLSWSLESRVTEPGMTKLVGHVLMGECANLMNAAQRIGRGMDDNDGIQVPQDSDIETHFRSEWSKPRFALDVDERATLASKLGIEDLEIPVNVSCQDVWLWTWDILRAIAEKRLTAKDFAGGEELPSNIPWDKVEKDVKDAFGQAGGGDGSVGSIAPSGAAANLLAAYILKNTMQYSSQGQLMNQVFSRIPRDQVKEQGAFGAMANAEGFGGFSRLAYFAGTVQYIQGLLLYLLSVAFPFFAFFLLAPGRAQSFLVWPALWVWVKSWDVGFALVGVARDLLWDFTVRGLNKEGVGVDWNQPWSVLSVIYSNDPVSNENTYWWVVSLLTIMVPFVTAHCCLGATNLFDAFKNSIDQTAGRFGQVSAGAARREYATQAEMEIDQKVNEQAYRAGVQAYKDVNDPSKGITNSFGVEYSKLGDAAKHHYAAVKFQEAAYESRISPEVVQQRTWLATVTGRKSSTVSTMAHAKVGADAYRNWLATGVMGREIGAGTNMPFFNTALESAGVFGSGSQHKPGLQWDSVSGILENYLKTVIPGGDD